MNDHENYIDQKLKAKLGVTTGFSVPEHYFDELSMSTNWAIHHSYPASANHLPEATNCFTTPVAYFENLPQQIESRLQFGSEEENFNQHIGASGMEVPDNYFEDSFTRILNHTIGQEQQSQKHIRRAQILRYYRYSSVAALFILAVAISFWVGTRQQEKEFVADLATQNHQPALDNLEYNDLLASLQNEDIGDEIYNLATLEEEGAPIHLNDSKQDQKSIDSSAENKKEIEDFLIENLDEIEEI